MAFRCWVLEGATWRPGAGCLRGGVGLSHPLPAAGVDNGIWILAVGLVLKTDRLGQCVTFPTGQGDTEAWGVSLSKSVSRSKGPPCHQCPAEICNKLVSVCRAML